MLDLQRFAPSAGESVDGKPDIPGYELIEMVGEGGMGAVWRAVDLGSERVVAIKVLKGLVWGSRTARSRFEREVGLASRLTHPNIARIYHSGVAQGHCWYTMEFVEGKPLVEYITEHQLDVTRTLQLVRKVALAVNFAHQHGIIHRDLKPSNILVKDDGEPVVMDFGLACSTDAADSSMYVTSEASTVGTLAYMAPEQLEKDTSAAGIPSDVYALGVVLYEALAGRLPYPDNGGRFQLQQAIVEGELAPLTRHRAEVDREVEAIVNHALEHAPERRYESAAALAHDIDAYLHGQPLSVRPLTLLYFLRKWVGRHRTDVVIATGILVVLAVVVSLSLMSVLRARSEAVRSAEATQRALYFNRIALADSEISAGHPTRATAALAECPPDLRNWEWDYLSRKANQSTRWIEASDSSIAALHLSSDGQRAVVLTHSGSLTRWGVEENQPVGQPVALGTILDADFDGHGRTAAVTRQDGSVVVIDLQDGRTLAELRDLPPPVRSLRIDAAGTRVAVVCSERRVHVWDVSTDREMAVSPRRGFGGGLAFVGSSLLAACREGRLALWRIDSGDVRDVSLPDGGSIKRVLGAHSKDGLVAALDENDHMHIFDSRDNAWRRLEPAIDASGRAGAIFLKRDNLLVCAGNDRVLHVWDPDAGRRLRTLRGHGMGITDMTAGARGTFASADRGGGIHLWSVEAAPPQATVKMRDLVLTLVHDPITGQTAAGTLKGEVEVWDEAVAPKADHRFALDGATVTGLAFLPDGEGLLVLASDGRLLIHRAGQLRTLASLEPETAQYASLSVSPDGQLAAVANTDGIGTIQLIDLQTTAVVAEVSGLPPMAWSPDGRFLVSTLATPGENRRALQYQAADAFHRAQPIAGQLADYTDLLFTPDGEALISASREGEVAFWRWGADVVETHRFQPYGGREVLSLGLSKDATRLVTAGRSVKLWDVATRTELLNLSGPSRHPYKAAFFNEARGAIIAARNHDLLIWRSE